MTNYKQLCAELIEDLALWLEYDGPPSRLPKEEDESYQLLVRARAALAEPEPEGPTDEEIMALMPQQMHEDLAFAVRTMAEHAGTDSTRAKGLMRIMLNRHVVDLVRAALARWGK